jgi:hypothetical protein
MQRGKIIDRLRSQRCLDDLVIPQLTDGISGGSWRSTLRAAKYGVVADLLLLTMHRLLLVRELDRILDRDDVMIPRR